MRVAKVLVSCYENEAVLIAMSNNARVFNAFFGVTWIRQAREIVPKRAPLRSNTPIWLSAMFYLRRRRTAELSTTVRQTPRAES